MPCRVDPVTHGDVSMLRSIQNSENSVGRMTLILGVNIPWGMTKQSISSPWPNSLSIRRYEVHMIRDTKSRYYAERPKILISQLNSSFFCLIFSHVIRIALVYMLPVACVSSDFFPRVFAKMSTGFFLKLPSFPHPPQQKKKSQVIVSFYSWGKSTQLFRSKIANWVGKTPASTLVITAGPARIALRGYVDVDVPSW